MTDQFRGVLGDAIKIAAAAWATFWAEPWTDRLTWLPEPLRFLLAAVVAALVLEVLLQIVGGWPKIRIEWRDPNDSVPLQEIRANFRKSTSSSQVFKVVISAPPGGWLGHQLLRLLMRADLTLLIQVQKASITPNRESSSDDERGSGKAITPDDSLCGFRVRLGAAPQYSGPWHYGEVRWRAEVALPQDQFPINYLLHHEKKFIRFAMNLVIRRSSNVNYFRAAGI